MRIMSEKKQYIMEAKEKYEEYEMLESCEHHFIQLCKNIVFKEIDTSDIENTIINIMYSEIKKYEQKYVKGE